MNPGVRQRAAFIILVAYLFSGVLLEIAHRDGIAPAGKPAIASHECGAREIHPSLDHAHPCTACQLQSQRVPLLVFHHLSIDAVLVRVGNVPTREDHARAADILHSGKRGPPSV